MKTKPRISIILSILSILSLSITTARAQNLIVSNSAVTQSGTHYENNGTANPALTISGSLGSFTGANVTLTGTAASGNGRIGANLTTQGTLNLTDSTINAAAYGIQLAGASSAILNNTNITATILTAHGIYLTTSSTVTMTGGTITTGTTGAHGVTAGSASYVTLQDVVINSYGDGIYLTGTSILAPSRANITVQNGIGLNMGASSTATITGGTITTLLGGNGVNLATMSSATLQNATINAFGVGLALSGTSTAALNNVAITTTGTTTASHGITLSTSSTLTMIGGSITTGTTGQIGLNAGSASYVTLQGTVINSYSDGIYLTGTSILAPYRANITTRNGNGINLDTSSTATITGGAITTLLGGNGARVVNISSLSLRDTTINAYGFGVTVGGTSTVTLNNVAITTGTTAGSNGISLATSSTLNMTGGSITTTGSNSHGVFTSGTTFVTMNNVNITTTSYRAAGLWNDGGCLTVTGGTITTAGDYAHGVYMGNPYDNTTILNNVTVRTHGEGAAGILLASSTNTSLKTLVMNGGSVVAAQGPALQFNNTDLTSRPQTWANGGGTYDITIKGGASLTGRTAIEMDGNWPAYDENNNLVPRYVQTVATMRVQEASTLTGDVTLKNSATLTLDLSGNSTLTGNVTSSGTSTLALALANSTLTAKTAVNDAATLNLSLYDSGTWYMVDNSTLTNLTAAKTARVNFPAPTAAGAYHKLTVNNNLGGEGGTFAMHTDIAAGKADLLSIGGTASTGAHRISLTNANDNAVTGTESPLLLVETAGGSATFTGTTTAGVYDYSVQNGAQVGDAFALPDTNWYLYRAGLSNIGNAIINTSAMLGYDWFYSLDALYLRMGDVRQENLGAPSFHSASASTAATRNEEQGTRNSSGNLWIRARGYRLNADASLSGRPFNEYAYGLTAGVDKAFHRNRDASTTLLGAFLDIGRIDRDFSGDNNIGATNSNNTGYTNSLSAGLYATYLRQTGWHADLVLKADRYKHHFDTTTADQLPVTGDYSNNALGASLEIGRRLQRADGYWVEPMVQAAYTWLQSADYRTGPAAAALGVTVDSVRAAQYRALVRFGRRVQNSRWLPYGKFGVVKTDLTGGALHIADGAGTLFVPDCDGWRVEFGAGTSYLINPSSQLYFDYEYDRAPHYERPWALNLGYRYGW